MDIAGSYTFDMPPDQVWSLLMDPAVISSCIPGCDTFEATGENSYRAKLTVALAAITGSYDGLVTLSAQNVTVRDILAEWARQCGCFVVNADRLAGAPLTVPIAFVAARQPDVLRSLLRETGGYALTPRRAGSTSVSQ